MAGQINGIFLSSHVLVGPCGFDKHSMQIFTPSDFSHVIVLQVFTPSDFPYITLLRR